MRAPQTTSIPAPRTRSRQLAASLLAGFASAPRQICPPSPGLSSTSNTRAPALAADAAAAIPAGPAPTTTIGLSAASLIRTDLHLRFAYSLARAHVRNSIDRGAALEANPHSA